MMVKLLYKKECEDCSIQARNEVLHDILTELREILQVPEQGDIIKHAHKTMRLITPAQGLRGTNDKGKTAACRDE